MQPDSGALDRKTKKKRKKRKKRRKRNTRKKEKSIVHSKYC
tara:strand:+ start:367 stop:489 length:123 start_codon:yes stop_codon:yes gene_type:complete